MQFLRRGLTAILALLVGGWAFMFALANDSVAEIDLLFITLGEQSVALWLIAAFVVGGVCGLLASLGAMISAWRTQSKLRAELRAQAANSLGVNRDGRDAAA